MVLEGGRGVRGTIPIPKATGEGIQKRGEKTAPRRAGGAISHLRRRSAVAGLNHRRSAGRCPGGSTILRNLVENRGTDGAGETGVDKSCRKTEAERSNNL